MTELYILIILITISFFFFSVLL